jgi:hypothetical protein
MVLGFGPTIWIRSRRKPRAENSKFYITFETELTGFFFCGNTLRNHPHSSRNAQRLTDRNTLRHLPPWVHVGLEDGADLGRDGEVPPFGTAEPLFAGGVLNAYYLGWWTPPAPAASPCMHGLYKRVSSCCSTEMSSPRFQPQLQQCHLALVDC